MTTANYTFEYFHGLLLQAPSPEEVRKTYIRLCKAVHPDLNPGIGSDPMKALNSAYKEVLLKWSGKNYKSSLDQDETFTYDPNLERLFVQIIKFLQADPYPTEIELVGSWLWVRGTNRDISPFTCPKEIMGTRHDPRPSWTSVDGTRTECRFQWSGGANQRWYFDLRWLVTRKHDAKPRQRKGINFARSRYGTTKIEAKPAA
jgi:hypothetical protein